MLMSMALVTTAKVWSDGTVAMVSVVVGRGLHVAMVTVAEDDVWGGE